MKKLKSIKRKNLRCTSLLVVVLLLFGWLANTSAQKTKILKIDTNALIDETQKESGEQDRMDLVWWIPEEYWVSFCENDPTITEEATEEIVKVFRPYTVIAVADGKIGTFGGVTYKSKADIQGSLRIKDSQGVYFRPLSEDLVDADTKSFLSIMRPIFVNMLGPLGENFHFFVFPGKSDKGQRIVNPNKKGTFSVLLGATEYRWRLPLSSLVPPKICPKCKEECNGAWNFCPWCGTKLPDNK